MNGTLVETAGRRQDLWSPSSRPQTGLLNIAWDVSGLFRPESHIPTSGSMASSPIANPALVSPSTTTHAGGTVLWPAPLPFEGSLRWRESAYHLQRLLINEVIGTQPVSPRVAGSLEQSVAARALNFQRTQPKCPLPALVFAAMVMPLEPVEKVVCQGEKDELRIWTIVNRASESQRYVIYDRQWDLLQTFQEQPIDFRLLDREDRPLDHLMEWSSRAFSIER